MRIGICYSTEERHRIIRCCRHRQMLHQESKLLGERFGAKPSGPARIRRFPQNHCQNRVSKSIISATVGEAAGSGSYKSREEPQFQQDASCNDLSLTGGFVISSGRKRQTIPPIQQGAWSPDFLSEKHWREKNRPDSDSRPITPPSQWASRSAIGGQLLAQGQANEKREVKDSS